MPVTTINPNGSGGGSGGGGGGGGSNGYGSNKVGSNGGGGRRPPAQSRPTAPRIIGPASLMLSSAAGIKGMTAAYAAGELTVASLATVGTASLVTAGVLGIVGAGVGIGWVVYELSTDSFAPQFPLSKFGAVNNIYGTTTFVGGLLVSGGNLQTALDYAQLSSDTKNILQIGRQYSPQVLRNQLVMAKDLVSATNAVIRQGAHAGQSFTAPVRSSSGPGVMRRKQNSVDPVSPLPRR